MCPGFVHQLFGKRLYVIRATPWIDLLADLCFLLDIDLRVTCDTCAEVRRQSDSLIQSVGVQRLRVTECSTHSLDTCTTYVVERVLLGKRPSRGLAVCTQSHGFRVLSTEGLNNLCPQHTSCTHLGNLHEVIHADSPEERQTRSESINIHTCVDTGTQILHTVSQRICQLDVSRSASLLHVVTGDRNAVELRHVLRGVLEDVGDDLHRELRRIDVRVTYHKLLQNIVLYSTSHLFELGSLLQTSIDVEGEDREHSAVHGHRYGHLVQRNTCKQYLHILERADTYACFTYVTYHTHVIGIVATMCRQVKGYRQTFLTGSQVTTVERI